ncbi:MAG TPA: S1 RNA-binding domain-containing protein, partial [Cryomorphaceae bacterium]|nr:S1 RNA-binding domain-containing protein [Cryomorphaceae bacterium]
MANEDKKVSEETENTQAAAESKPAETQEKVTESTEETAKAEEPKAKVKEEKKEDKVKAESTASEEKDSTKEEAKELAKETEVEENKAAKDRTLEVKDDKDVDPDGNDIVTRQKEEEVGRDDEDGDELNLYEGREEFDPENFDWDKFEHGAEDYEEKERAQLDEMYDDTLNAVQQGEVVKGTVVDITKKEVVVNINYKSEGIVTANEFRYNEDLSIGDTVDVYVESLEDKNGQLDISHKTARMHEAWRKVNLALEDNSIITGSIKCRTKGGLIADVFGLEAFLPGSQIDVKPIRDYDMYVGKKMEFKVVKINHEFKNVVVSHKALIEAELEEQKKQIIGGLEKGQVLEGTVKNITSYGVFIDLGGVDGLIHITDLSWGRINHPEEVVELDQKINVVILDFDDDKKRIALGLKQLTDHPWDTISDEVQVGSKVKGKVVVIADYGAFVEIAPGVEGLVHVSEMSWSQHLRSAQDF